MNRSRLSLPPGRTGMRAWILVAASAALTGGCTSNLEQVLFVSVNAAARTALDSWFTTLVNAVAASFGG